MRNKFIQILSLAAATAVLSMAAPSAMANVELVTNGAFSNGASGWNMHMPVSTGWGVGGSAAALTGCVGHDCVATLNEGAYFGQTVTTTAGSAYELSFFAGENSGPTSEFSLFWNGLLIADEVDPANNTVDFVTNANMVRYTYNVVATGASTYFEIHGRQDPAASVLTIFPS